MKRLIGLALALCLCLGLLPTAAFASGSSASLTGPGTVRAGNTITLSFNLSGSGLYGVEGSLSYDSSQLTLTGTSKKLSAWDLQFNGNTFVAYDNNLSNPINNATVFTATFKVNGNLAAGTAIRVSVSGIASDGTNEAGVSAAYSATLAAPLSGNCDLTGLTVNNATISPAFSPNTTSYTASVPFSVEKLSLSATPADKATVSISNPALTANATTNVTITVTAENGATKTYTIAVKRAQDPNYVPSGNNDLASLSVDGFLLSPVFSADLTNYVIWLPYEVEGVSVSGTPADSRASVKVVGGSELAAGEDNEIKVICTAENGSEKEYIIIAKRAAAHDAEPEPETPDLSGYTTNEAYPGLYFLSEETPEFVSTTAYLLMNNQLILVAGYKEYREGGLLGLTGTDGIEEQVSATPEEVYTRFQEMLAVACRFLDPDWAPESTEPAPEEPAPSDKNESPTLGLPWWLLLVICVVCLAGGALIGATLSGMNRGGHVSHGKRGKRQAP